MSDEKKDEKSKSAKLPEPWARPGDTWARHCEWVTDATKHEIAGVWRPARGDRAGMVVRLAAGYELSFETITEASRPDRFINAFTAIDGVVMPSYSIPAVREIVGALIRMAEIDKDRDERETFRGIGADHLRGCLQGGRVNAFALENAAEAYYAVARFQRKTGGLHGDAGEQWPPLMYARDKRLLLISRRLFEAHAKRATRTAFSPMFQMPRCGWDDVDLQPYAPATIKGPRLKARLWAIPEGWEGIVIEGPETPGDGSEPRDANGDAETHGAAPTPTRARVGAVLRSSTRLHVSGDGTTQIDYAALSGDINHGRDAARREQER